MHIYMNRYMHVCMYKGIRFLKLRAGAKLMIIHIRVCMYMYMCRKSFFETPLRHMFVCVCALVFIFIGICVVRNSAFWTSYLLVVHSARMRTSACICLCWCRCIYICIRRCKCVCVSEFVFWNSYLLIGREREYRCVCKCVCTCLCYAYAYVYV